MKAFFKCALEAFLKGLFICRSRATADNRPMRPPRAPSTLHRQADLRVRGLSLAGAVLAVGLAWPAAWAGDKGGHERARAAVQAGEVLPLATVLERLKRSHPGQVLELELERDDGRWIYEVKLLQADGLLLTLDVDARTALVLEVKRKHDRNGARQAKPQKDDRQ